MNIEDLKRAVTANNKKAMRKYPPKGKQVCNTCHHWHKNGGNCASPGGQCVAANYLPLNFKVNR